MFTHEGSVTRQMQKSEFSFIDPDDFRGSVLAWYDTNARALPWRSPVGNVPDPYHVWLSEVMLQQTTVPAVIQYFTKFTRLWPSVEELTKADQDDILREWAGLGYYARARNLHKCAVEVVTHFGGAFPQTLEELESLPGIGAYTAAAIRSIAFDKPASVVDGNIERIYARVMALKTPLPKGKVEIKALAHYLSDERHDRPGCYAQALMDIGSMICTPKNPDCASCPVSNYCAAFHQGEAELYPYKQKKQPKPVRYGVALWITYECGQRLLIERRPDKGLLGGMRGLPGTSWEKDRTLSDCSEELILLLKNLNLSTDLPQLTKLPEIRHVFTHFELRLKILAVSLGDANAAQIPANYFHVNLSESKSLGLPTVFKKAYNVMVKL